MQKTPGSMPGTHTAAHDHLELQFPETQSPLLSSCDAGHAHVQAGETHEVKHGCNNKDEKSAYSLEPAGVWASWASSAPWCSTQAVWVGLQKSQMAVLPGTWSPDFRWKLA